MIDQKFIDALQIIHDRLEGSKIQWAITGSLGMALRGMALDIHDIDIQTDRQDAYEFEKLFPEYVVTPVYGRASEKIRSHFGILQIGEIKVEIMGGMQKLLPDQSWEKPIKVREKCDWVKSEGMVLPVMTLAHEYQAYLTMGREEKAEKIRQWMENRSKA